MPAWQGQLVVTLFVRAVHTGGYLYIEWEYYVLPPIRREFRTIDRRYSSSSGSQLWRSVKWGSRRFMPALVRAPFLIASDYRRYRAERRRRTSQERAIEHGHDFNYGASRSIREMACGLSRDHHFLARDEIMYVLLSQETLVRGIRSFLRKHDVDLGEFDSQVQAITKATFQFFDVNISNVSGSAVAVGDKSKAKNS